ncbi:MAG: hypothetical protein ACOZCL_15820 [Bacillota bacterium]
MKEYFALKLLDRLRKIYENMGIDYTIMRKVLRLKLIMDERRVPTIIMNYDEKKEGNYFKKSLIYYGFIGLIITIFIFPPYPLFFKMNVVFGMIVFMLLTTMISDFSSVLLDLRDKNILSHRPIDTRTLNAAKITHVMIYMATIVAVVAGPAMIAGSIRYGIPFLLLYIVEMIFITAFVLFLTSMMYFMILKIFDGEKLKDIINYFQIFFSVVIIIGYQLIGRIFSVFNMQIVFTPSWWSYLLPSAWFAAPFSIVLQGDTNIHFICFSIIGIVVPTVLLLIYFKAVVPYFERSLSKLNNSSSKESKSLPKRIKRGRKIASLFCKDGQENVFFRFTQTLVSNERKIKLRLYPNIAFGIIFPFIMLLSRLNHKMSLEEILTTIRGGKQYIALYLSIMILASNIQFMSFSERYKGGWIYKALPIENPSVIYRGALKGYMTRFIILPFLITAVIFLLIYGTVILPDIILMLLNLLLLTVIVFALTGKKLPFASEFVNYKEGQMEAVIAPMLICGLFAAIHWGLTFVDYGVPVLAGIALMVLIPVWKLSTKLTWSKPAIKKGG